jgi:signal transduction histidine kinase
VILLDVMMPGMDGFETLANLRAIPAAQNTPVILLTAYELNARAMEKAHGMGPVDYVLKPLPPEILRSKVASLVSLQRRGEEIRRRGAALAAKDRDIAMLAHDLQNPLTAIMASARLLPGADPDSRARITERISRAAGRMSEMIRDLTDYARAGRGAIPITPAPMDLGDLGRELVEESRLADSSRRIEVVCAGEIKGEWDRNRLYQAVSNLLANAVKYGAGKVVVRVQGAASNVEVAVHNDGPPIAADLLPVIFQPFERGPQSRAGLGLGLYIVREIARAHQGDVAVTSSAKTGTTFVLRLPRSRTRG